MPFSSINAHNCDDVWNFLSTHKKSENIGRFSIFGAVYLTLVAALGSGGRCGDVIVLEKRHLFNTTIVRNIISSFLKA